MMFNGVEAQYDIVITARVAPNRNRETYGIMQTRQLIMIWMSLFVFKVLVHMCA